MPTIRGASVFALAVCSLFAAEERKGAAGDGITKLVVEPAPLVFSAPGEQRTVVVSGIAASGEKLDLTGRTRIRVAGEAVRLEEDGLLTAVAPGTAELTFEAAGLSATATATVAEKPPAKVTFLRDVLPVLNKTGCTSGPCHGGAKGKNGFKLSLRGYDPEFDYRALLYDLSGRRFNRADPARSLMLAKPTQQVAHGGGLRFEVGSRYYQTIIDWIAGGVEFGDPEKEKVVRIEVLPNDLFMHAPGREQRVVVIAHYADGLVRDVTREASIGSSNTETAKVEDNLATGLRIGESTLLVRYEGRFETVPVTILNPEPGFVWKQLARHNYIDELIDRKLQRLKIQPSDLADDAEFLRRVSLDLTGKVPEPAKIRAFLADKTDTVKKRARLIDELLASDAYADYWTLKWGDLLRSNRKFMTDKGMWEFREWLRTSIATDKPYNRLVEELLTSKGSAYEHPEANFFRVARDPKDAMETTTQLFLGVRMVCAQCHDHPFERWTQTQYFQMSAFFAAVGVRPGFQSGEEIVYLRRDDADLKHPKDGRVVAPEYLVATAGAPPIPDEGDKRRALVQWLTSKDNPFFARAIVNRVWSYFFGAGIIDPVDDIRASNPPVNPALLDALADDFVKSGFDLRHLMRTIANSRTYQATFRTNEWNEGDLINFSHQVPRRLTAEQLADAISQATGVRFELPGAPEDLTPIQAPDPHAGMGGFLDLFGRPGRETSCECERRNNISLPQTLNLINGPDLAEKIADPEGRVARLILEGASDRELIEELYLVSVARLPSPSEYDLAVTHLRKQPGRAGAAQDLSWALLNSNGFVFNH